MHDLEDGLPLLQLACNWLLDACESRERYEAVNAYLHRFLYLHANIIAGIGDSINVGHNETTEQEKQRRKEQHEKLLESVAALRLAHQQAADALRDKMQHALCLLRHFSRMV